MKDLIPDKKNTELWARLSELMPLILLIAGFVASHNFLYDYMSYLFRFSLFISVCFIVSDCIHFQKKAKKTA
jgi:hypothetical protein